LSVRPPCAQKRLAAVMDLFGHHRGDGGITSPALPITTAGASVTPAKKPN